jgi:hypothetical protein
MTLSFLGMALKGQSTLSVITNKCWSSSLFHFSVPVESCISHTVLAELNRFQFVRPEKSEEILSFGQVLSGVIRNAE